MNPYERAQAKRFLRSLSDRDLVDHVRGLNAVDRAVSNYRRTVPDPPVWRRAD